MSTITCCHLRTSVTILLRIKTKRTWTWTIRCDGDSHPISPKAEAPPPVQKYRRRRKIQQKQRNLKCLYAIIPAVHAWCAQHPSPLCWRHGAQDVVCKYSGCDERGILSRLCSDHGGLVETATLQFACAPATFSADLLMSLNRTKALIPQA